MSLRYRWRPDPGLPPTGPDRVGQRIFPDDDAGCESGPHGAGPRLEQPLASDDWTDIALLPQGQFKPPIGVEYLLRAQLRCEPRRARIDRIELVR